MRTLKDILDYDQAPLVQWEPVIGEEPSEGKRHEDAIIYGAIGQVLSDSGAQTVTGVIADEARLELYIAANLPQTQEVTHLTLQGAFEKAARHNVERASTANTEKVRVTTDADSIQPGSQDAVVLNMILGCLAVPAHFENIVNLVRYSASLLKPTGELIVVRPNPAAGGAFSTYACNTAPGCLTGGEEYEFTVRGLEEFGPMKNLHTPDEFLAPLFAAAGFSEGRTKDIADHSFSGETVREEPAFLLTQYTLNA